MKRSKITGRIGKPLVFFVSLIPALWLVSEWALYLDGAPHELGFNPHETSNRFTGEWALRFLLMTLAIRPVSKIFLWPQAVSFRRMFGLFAFFYACLHVLSYLGLDLLFDFAALLEDVVKRPYITIGMTAFVLLIPLALTSTAKWVKRLGAKRWKMLHRLVYLISILAIIHFFMMRKGLQFEPLVYGAVLVILLLLRMPLGVKRWAQR